MLENWIGLKHCQQEKTRELVKTYQIYHAKIPSSRRTKPRKRFKAPLIARVVATADLEEYPPFLIFVFSFALDVVSDTKT